MVSSPYPQFFFVRHAPALEGLDYLMPTEATGLSDDYSTRSVPFRAKLLRLLGRQTWIPRGQDRILRAIWPPGKRLPFVVDFFGFRYPGNMAEFIDWNVFAYGCYAPAELALLAALSSELRKRKSRIIVFDVGANVGHHTLFMAGHADEVVAFEPFPPLLQRIREKIDLNRLTNVRLVPTALGDSDGSLQYFPGREGMSGMGSFVSEEVRRNHDKDPVSLQIRRGDQISSELALPPMDILKIDVEGFEAGVLRGFRERIQRDRPVVLMEMTNLSGKGFESEQNFRECFWEGAAFAGVTGCSRRQYRLTPFRFSGPGASGEILVAPPEMADFITRRISGAR